jgi:PST family polysaccharide transporter
MNHITSLREKIIPSFIRQRLEGRAELRRILSNTSWLIVDNVIKLLAGLIVGAMVARYLGPTRYGLFNYALAYIVIFASIVGLGLRDIVIRDIVQSPKDKYPLLGTSFILQFVTSLIIVGSLISIASFIRLESTVVRYLIGIISGILVFQTVSNTFDYWFKSQVQSKYTVWANSIALVLIATVKVVLILIEAPLVAFAWALLIQMAVFSVILAILYSMSGEVLLKWRFKFQITKNLLKDSWPLIISNFAIVLYMKFGQIMLGNLSNIETLGIYSAAIRLSELWYFIPMALAFSFFPSIVRSREGMSIKDYRKRMQSFYDLMTGIAYIIAIGLTLTAPILVITLFGEDYVDAIPILRIHIWAFIFVTIGIARSRWLIAENMTKFAMVSAVLGAVTNIGLNYWLIPSYGGLGAAWATIISYAVSGYFSTIISKPLWPVFGQLSLSLIVPFRIPSILMSIPK